MYQQLINSSFIVIFLIYISFCVYCFVNCCSYIYNIQNLNDKYYKYVCLYTFTYFLKCYKIEYYVMNWANYEILTNNNDVFCIII